jgi:phosphohistidine swiveling domain-containing protein
VVISEEKGATESMAVIPDHAGVPQARGAQPVEEVVDVKI